MTRMVKHDDVVKAVCTIHDEVGYNNFMVKELSYNTGYVMQHMSHRGMVSRIKRLSGGYTVWRLNKHKKVMLALAEAPTTFGWFWSM